MNKIVFTILTSAICSFTSGQAYFIKQFSESHTAQRTCIADNGEGELAFAYTPINWEWCYPLVFIKTDTMGNEVSAKYFDSDEIVALVSDKTDGYLLTSRCEDIHTGDHYIIKFDRNGNIDWSGYKGV